MSTTAALVFAFIVAGFVMGGLVLVSSSMLSEQSIGTTIPTAPSEHVNTTTDLISGTGEMVPGLLLPVLILISAFAAISAIYLFTKRR